MTPRWEQLSAAYYDIRAGIGFNKSPALYGAFPTDPYSHTPKGQGAKQPGMTGQVKEEILARFGELGVQVEEGVLAFDPVLLREQEFLAEAAEFAYVDVFGTAGVLPLPAGALAFTFCQTPVVLMRASQSAIEIFYADGRSERIAGLRLDQTTSRRIFQRDGSIQHLVVRAPAG